MRFYKSNYICLYQIGIYKAHCTVIYFVSPENWKKHFSNLLGPQIPPSPEDDLMAKYVTENCDKLGSELENPFSRSELMEGISSLDNNKSSSLDRISNEILKASKQIISEPVLILFNAILSSSLYPTSWKYDILTPLHKSNEKNEPNNFWGISVSLCFGKFFNKLLQKRLDKLCKSKGLISDMQGSGKTGSRTSDHLMIVKFLTDKYVKQQGKNLYTCFVDLHKVYDTVPRIFFFTPYCMII